MDTYALLFTSLVFFAIGLIGLAILLGYAVRLYSLGAKLYPKQLPKYPEALKRKMLLKRIAVEYEFLFRTPTFIKDAGFARSIAAMRVLYWITISSLLLSIVTTFFI